MFNRFKPLTGRAGLTKAKSLILAAFIGGVMAVPSSVFAQVAANCTYSIYEDSPNGWTLKVNFQLDQLFSFRDFNVMVADDLGGQITPFNVFVGTQTNYVGGVPTPPHGLSVGFSQFAPTFQFGAYSVANVTLIPSGATTTIPLAFGNDTIAGFPSPASVTVTRADSTSYSPMTVMVTFGNPPDPVALINNAYAMIAALASNQFDAGGHKNSLLSYLNNAKNCVSGNSVTAQDVVNAQNELLKAINRTDGCFLHNAPDTSGNGKDWINNCAAQGPVYAALVAALNAL